MSACRRLTIRVVKTMAGKEAPVASMATQMNCAEPAKTSTDIMVMAHQGSPACWAKTPRARPMGK